MTKKTRVSILLSLLFLLICLAAAINLAPVFLDINTYKGLIERRLSDYTGTSVSIGSIQLAIKHNIELEFNNIAIKERGVTPSPSRQEGVIVSAEKIKLFIKIIPLIKKKTIVVRSLYLKVPDIVIKRDREGYFNISRIVSNLYVPQLKFEAEKVGQGQESMVKGLFYFRSIILGYLSSFNLQSSITDIKVDSGRMTFIDQFAEGQSIPLTAENLNIVIEKPLFRRTIQVEINGNIANKHQPALFNFSGIVENRSQEPGVGSQESGVRKSLDSRLTTHDSRLYSNFYLSDGHIKVNYLPVSLFNSYLKTYLPPELSAISYQLPLWLDIDTSIQGNLSGGFESAGDVNFRTPLPQRGVEVLSDPLSPHYGSLKYTMSLGRDFIDFKSLQLKVGDLFVNGKCLLDGFTPPPSPSLQPPLSPPSKGGEWGGARITFDFSIPGLDIKKVKRYIPDKVLPLDTVRSLEEVVKGGELDIKSLKFSGMIDQIIRLNNPLNFKLLSGTIDVKNLDMDVDKGKYKFRKLNGPLTLKDGELRFAEAAGIYQDCRIASMSGSISEVLSSPFLKLSARGEADVRHAQGFLLEAVHPRYKKDIAQSFRFESGVVSGDMKITGPIIDPTPYRIEGDVELNGVALRHIGLKLPFKNIEGSFHFSPEEFYMKKIDWDMGDSRFGMDGRVKEFDSEKPFLDINIYSMLSLSDAKNLGLDRIEKLSKAEGVSEINLSLKGIPGNLTISESLDLTNAAYKYEPWLEKNIGSSNQIKFKGRVNSSTLYIDDLSVSLETVNINIKGKVNDFNDPRFILSISTDEMNIADVVKFLVRVEDTNAEGAVSLQLNTAGSMKDLKDIKLKGRLSIRNVGFKLTYLPMPVRNLNAAADFTSSRIFIPSASGIVGDSPVRFSASIKEFANPVIEFAMQASSVNIDDLFPVSSKEDRGDEDKKDTIFERITWRGKVAVTKGKLRGLPLESMMFNIYFNKDMMKIKNLLFKGFNGSYTGKGWLEWDRSEGTEFFLENKIINMNIENLYERLPKAFHDLHGRIDASFKIAGKGKEAEDIKRSLKGNLSIAMHNGRINRFHILSKIFSLLNVYQIFKFKLPDLVTEGMPYNSIRAIFEIKDGIASTEDILIDSDSMRITAVGELDIKNKQMDMTVGVQPFQTIDKIVSNIPLAGRILTGDKKALIVFYYMVKGDMADPEVTAVPLESLGEGIFSVIKRLLLTPQELLSPKK